LKVAAKELEVTSGQEACQGAQDAKDNDHIMHGKDGNHNMPKIDIIAWRRQQPQHGQDIDGGHQNMATVKKRKRKRKNN